MDKVNEFSAGLAPQSDTVSFRAEQGKGIHVPFSLYIISFIVLIAFGGVAVKTVQEKKDGKGGSQKDSFKK
ncbi:MAG: hypothetical protein WAX38_03660 [Minisyncoccia bacterium]